MACGGYFVLVAFVFCIQATQWTSFCRLGHDAFAVGAPRQVSVAERKELRDEVLEAFDHAYGSYIQNAYPADELMPLSCRGRGWKHRTRGTIDDALGGYALTMVDSLDMHAVVGDGEGFRAATTTLLRDFRSGVLTFDRDVVVSVFEASIRVLGGLLSAHQIATELGPSGRLGPPGWYSGELLSLAHDLGNRLLPAFDTPLGIPVHRVNLRKGIPRGETHDTCSAAAGTFLVEFGALSRLTGDPSFEAAARRAVAALWERRSSLGLVGAGVKGSTGRWESRTASIGAGTDSFYEYLDKSARLFDDAEMAAMFQEAYAGVEEHLTWDTGGGGRWHVEVDMWKGNQRNPVNYRVSSLQAFWPAVQAGAGDVEEAERTYDTLFGLWKAYGALPDFYDVSSDSLLHYGRDSPLRPEMAESTLALYRATGSTKYLSAGKQLLRALQDISRVSCGYASVGDVKSLRLDDRMDSFFIAETLKYLLLLFDSSLPSEERNSIFCTPEQEGEVERHHARRAAAANTTASASAAAAGSNATASESSEPPVFSSVGGGSSGGGFSSSVPIGGKGSVAGSGGGNSGDRDGVDGDDGDGTGVGGTEPGSPSSSASSSSKFAPQCLLWADTVLSTEGHPFLASALAAAKPGTAATPASAGGGRGGDGIPVELVRLDHDGGGLRVSGESPRECSSPASPASMKRTDQQQHCVPPSSSPSATAPASSSVQPSLSAAAPAAAAKTGSAPPRAEPHETVVGRVMGAVKPVRNKQRREGTDPPRAKATTRTATIEKSGREAGRELDQDGRSIGGGGSGGGPSVSRLSLFDPRHHYSRAVRSEGFASRPKFAELDVTCLHTSNGSPRCEIFAAGPDVRAFMTRAVGEQDWAKAALRVVEWVSETAFFQEEVTHRNGGEEEEQDGEGSGGGSSSSGGRRSSGQSGSDPGRVRRQGALYRLHQISPTPAVVAQAVAARARATAAAAAAAEAAEAAAMAAEAAAAAAEEAAAAAVVADLA